MDIDQAKQILSTYRENHAPTEEQQAALTLLESDDALAAWYTEDQSFDAAIRDKLSEVVAPPSSMDDLLQQLRGAPNVVTLPEQRTSRRQALALVATLVGLLAIIGLVIQGRSQSIDDMATFRSDMVEFVRSMTETDVTKGNHMIIAATLRKGGAPLSTNVTARFGEGAEMGCLVRDWHDTKVSMVCLNVGSDGQVVHLFAIAKDALSITGEDQMNHVVEEQNLKTKAWQEGEHYFLLVGDSEETELPNV